MTANGLLQIAVFCAVVTATAIPLGKYMARVFTGERNFLSPVLGPVERAIYRLSGVDAKKEQHWLTYAFGLLLFHVICFATLYGLMRLQYYLPFNPQGMTGVEPSLALNTAISFTTNTNWQNYGGETTLGYFHPDGRAHSSQFRLGRCRHRRRHRAHPRLHPPLGPDYRQFLGRSHPLHPLHPASLLDRCRIGAGLAGPAAKPGRLCRCHDAGGAKQTIAQGPVASQIVIKTVGTNGGGFFNVNAAHPYENPNALTNFLTMWMEFLIGAASPSPLGAWSATCARAGRCSGSWGSCSWPAF